LICLLFPISALEEELESFMSLIFDFITVRFSNLLNSSYLTFKENLLGSARTVLSLFVLTSIASGFFCLSTLSVFFEIANQYDKTEALKITAVLAASILISMLSLTLLIYFFRIKKYQFDLKTEVKAEPPKDQSLEQALAILIVEFAKDREFARKQAQVKTNLNADLRNSDLAI
jgi:hypothetical protein